MKLYESKQYMTIYEDDDYMVWVDIVKSFINIFIQAKGLTLHFSHEDFQDFREALSNQTLIDMDEEFSEIYMEERGIGLYFDREEFSHFMEILNSLEIIPGWFLCWN